MPTKEGREILISKKVTTQPTEAKYKHRQPELLIIYANRLVLRKNV